MDKEKQLGFQYTGHFGAYRHDDPETSKQAAESIDVTTLESAVVAALRKNSGGLTTHEIAVALGFSLWSTSPRLRPLVRKGFVVDSGERRETPSGRKAIVWKLAA